MPVGEGAKAVCGSLHNPRLEEMTGASVVSCPTIRVRGLCIRLFPQTDPCQAVNQPPRNLETAMLSRALKVYSAQIARRSYAGFRNKHSWLLLIGRQLHLEVKKAHPKTNREVFAGLEAQGLPCAKSSSPANTESFGDSMAPFQILSVTPRRKPARRVLATQTKSLFVLRPLIGWASRRGG